MASFSDCGGHGLVAELDEKRSTENHRRAPRVETVRSDGGWLNKFASVFPRLAGGGNRLDLVAKQPLSKGWSKRLYLAKGARISCRAGKVWITLDGGGEDIVLAACESRNFGPGTRLLVEALAPSRISLEAL
ncbi:MAG: DUF2917 domain-containing protein [Terrimicrobiaceae bacterium]